MYLQTGVSAPNTDATFNATFDLVFVPGPGAVTLWCFAGVLGGLRRRRPGLNDVAPISPVSGVPTAVDNIGD